VCTSPKPVASAPRSEAVAYVATFSLLLFLPALICFLRDAIDDPDVWWHLKAGEWIFQHRAWPTTDTFSSHGAGKPWTAYSWIAELLLYGLYQGLGLRGLVLYTAGLSVAIVAAFHGLVRRLSQNTVLAVALTLAAALGLIPFRTPRPWLFSILLFVVELDLLLTAGRTGNRRLLLWLIPLFLLWANVHIQFLLGLVVLGMAVAEPLLARLAPASIINDDSRRISFRWMVLVFVLCAAATLANPYHYHLYEVARQLVGQSKLWNEIQELGAMRFRSLANWTALAVTVGAAFVLGWRRQTRLLLALLFPMAVYLGFRSRRDVWLVLLVGLTVFAYVGPRPASHRREVNGPFRTVGRRPAPARLNWAVAGVISLLLVCGALLLRESRLRDKVARGFPVQAAEFIAGTHAAGPMFNPFGWGGYLIYNLPQVPVSIDGRTMVHGQERILRHADTLRGKEGWQDDPELAQAGLVVLPRNRPLAALLKLDGRFRLAYEDSVAVVFTRNTNHSTQEKPT